MFPPAAATGEPGAKPSAAPARLGDAQLVGQRLIAGFSGSSPSRGLVDRIRSGRLAGVILFAANFDSRSDAERLARRLERIRRPRGLRDPLLVMVDQEGGGVKRLPGPPSLSAEQMGDAGTSTCRKQGRATGRLLDRTAIGVDLAPVLDVARPGGAIESEHRSFGRDPGRVKRCGGAFAAGLERGGTVPTAKHFPGLGAAQVNTDAAVQHIGISKRRLRRVDEAPYRGFIGDGARDRMVMLSSAVYTSFSQRPAALTRSLATGELRGRLGFRGVSITDALQTASTAPFGGPTGAAVRAARAGTDLLLFTDLGAAKRAARPLRDLLRRRRNAFEASVDRILRLRSAIASR